MAHSTQHDAQIKALEGRLNQLNDRLSSFSGHARQVSELIPIIHNPGWTTLPELMLVSGLVDAIIQHTDLVTQLHTTLVNGAKAIGKQ